MKMESEAFLAKRTNMDVHNGLDTASPKEQINGVEAAVTDDREATQDISERAQLKHSSEVQEAADKTAADRILEQIKNGKSAERIEPDRENDPTLILFERVNNPVIQKQMADLLVENENYRATETEDKWVFVVDENGKTVFADEGYGAPLQKNLGAQLRFPDYVKKTRAELAQEVKERVVSVTQLGGEKNVAHLYPEGYPSIQDFAYSSKLDEVFVNGQHTLGENTGKLTPQQLATILAHEKGHQIRRYGDETYLNNRFREIIDWRNLNMTPDELGFLKSVDVLSSNATLEQANQTQQSYLDANEILERMSQIKNYFGFKGDEVFTREHLDYAREHYVKDTGFDNNMGVFFRAITPEKEDEFIEGMNTLGV